MNQNKILVIGETCIDTFVYGASVRLSPEADAPVFLPKYCVMSNGMASNVANNIKSMGFEVDLITNTTPIRKTRYVNHLTNQCYLRVDENDSVDPVDLSCIKNIEDYEAVVISDYCKGFLSIDDIQWMSENAMLTILDTKKILDDWCHSIDFIKLNRIEAELNKEFLDKNDLYNPIYLITLDQDGCMCNGVLYPADKVENADVSGAGDTFVAAFITDYLKNDSLENAIQFAVKCSSKVVSERGVSVYAD